MSAIEDAGMLGELFSDLPRGSDSMTIVEQRLQLFSELRVGRVAAYKYYSDIATFAPAVEQQRSTCEKWMKVDELPGESVFHRILGDTDEETCVATQADLIAWCTGYDAVLHARGAIERLSQSNGS